jgi:predicted molibdopterin-dependent oxidoreductase YjgC
MTEGRIELPWERTMRLHGQFHRLPDMPREVIPCVVDGADVSAFAGDTVLTAVLSHRRSLRPAEFSNARRSGFCLMGACQDCWVHLESGERIRACSTPLIAGMRIVSTAGRVPHD